ncbi:hypothetical protein ACWELB_03235 [Streptomyces asiaticus]|uniref:hypothetical protein n=1 Tax=Streptomyces asiaticus TaxID=114695 RepID=UPI0039BDE0A5
MAAAGGHVPPAGATAPHEHLDAGGSVGVDVSGNRQALDVLLEMVSWADCT